MTRARTSWRLLAIGAVLVAIASGAARSAGAATTPGVIAYLQYSGGHWQVWTMREDGTDPRPLTRSPIDKARVSWFPDGRAVLATTIDGKLLRVDAETETEAALPIQIGGQSFPQGLPGMTDAVVSPAGNEIALSVSLSNVDNHEIWLVDAQTGSSRRVTDGPGIHHEPAFSPDGVWLYYLEGEGGQEHNVRRMRLPSGPTETLTAGALYHFDVSVSVRGDVAFSSNRSGNYEIWVLPSGAREPFQVTHDPAADARPAWGPAGDALVFESSRGGAPNLWRVGIGDGQAAGPPMRLTRDPIGARAPAWWGGAAGQQ